MRVCSLPTDRQKVQTQDILLSILALTCFEILVILILVSFQYNFEKISLISLPSDPYITYKVGRGQPFYEADFFL